jgi:hypothetical protein
MRILAKGFEGAWSAMKKRKFGLSSGLNHGVPAAGPHPPKRSTFAEEMACLLLCVLFFCHFALSLTMMLPQLCRTFAKMCGTSCQASLSAYKLGTKCTNNVHPAWLAGAVCSSSC